MTVKTFNSSIADTRDTRTASDWFGLSRIHGMLTLRRTRRDLADLTDDQLRDIGITHDAAQKESKRPFWDLSDHWLARR